MKAQVTSITTASTSNSASAAQQRADVRGELKRQLCSLLDSTMRETWLPMGFRVLVVQNFPAMRRITDRKRISYTALESYVAHLSEEAEPYKVFAKRSAALLALKTLRAELQSVQVAA